MSDFIRDSSSMQQYKKRNCGGIDHSILTRPCKANDTYCGSWTSKFFYPESCYYFNISTFGARNCLKNKTIAVRRHNKYVIVLVDLYFDCY